MTWGATGLWELGRCVCGVGGEGGVPRTGPAPRWAELAEDLQRAASGSVRRRASVLGVAPWWSRACLGAAARGAGCRPWRSPPWSARASRGCEEGAWGRRQRQRRLGRVHTEWGETGGSRANAREGPRLWERPRWLRGLHPRNRRGGPNAAQKTERQTPSGPAARGGKTSPATLLGAAWRAFLGPEYVTEACVPEACGGGGLHPGFP